jgi:type VI secretion system protein ImpA
MIAAPAGWRIITRTAAFVTPTHGLPMLDTPAEPIPSPSSEATAAPPAPFALPPVSAEDPCGPDLDLEGDAEFLNFVAATEGLLPVNYYNFDRGTIDFPAAFQTLDALVKRTLDVRLLVLGAKLSILNRDIAGFSKRVEQVAWLIGAHWDEAHPRAEGGEFAVRELQIETLDENAVVLLPLQYAPLVERAREGALSYRDHLVATGAAEPRVITRINRLTGESETAADEKFMAPAMIERILRDIEIERLAGAYETLNGLGAALQSIQATTKERRGRASLVKLEKLDKLVRGMTEFLRAALVKRDPSLAPAAAPSDGEAAQGSPEGAPSAALARSAFASRAEADAALSAALGYFVGVEPTSPAVLLIRQARETMGKNLYEVMQLVAPSSADEARVFVGPGDVFAVPLKSLSEAPTAGIERAEAAPATSRVEAIALIDSVVQHMQRAEPSSPVPYLLERAKALASRDFVSLLNDILSEEAVAKLKKRD